MKNLLIAMFAATTMAFVVTGCCSTSACKAAPCGDAACVKAKCTTCTDKCNCKKACPMKADAKACPMKADAKDCPKK